MKGKSPAARRPHPGSTAASVVRHVRRWPFVADPIVDVFVLVAVGIDALQLTRPGFLFGLTSDISDYLGAAVRLVSGSVPYRDFVFLQPPGIVVLLSPFAFVAHLIGTRDALAIVRLLTLIVAGANVLLVGRLVRHRGRLATLVACGLMALYPAERYALNAGLLEPITVRSMKPQCPRVGACRPKWSPR